jgi:hypothetical protein
LIINSRCDMYALVPRCVSCPALADVPQRYEGGFRSDTQAKDSTAIVLQALMHDGPLSPDDERKPTDRHQTTGAQSRVADAS